MTQTVAWSLSLVWQLPRPPPAPTTNAVTMTVSGVPRRARQKTAPPFPCCAMERRMLSRL